MLNHASLLLMVLYYMEPPLGVTGTFQGQQTSTPEFTRIMLIDLGHRFESTVVQRR